MPPQDRSNMSREALEAMARGERYVAPIEAAPLRSRANMSREALEAMARGERYIAPPESTSVMSRIGRFTAEHGEIPGSIAGGLAGAAYGTAILPGVGTVIGGILGGAAGAFTGSLASDVYQDERLDFESALKEGAISATFDTVTLGVGKLVRPVARSLGVNTADLVMNLIGRGDSNAPKALTKLSSDVAAGSKQSKQLTQELLEAGGGSLSALQTGQAGFVRATAEEIGEIGLFSAGQATKRIAANNAALYRESQRLIDGIDPMLARLPEAVGEEIYGVVEAGRRAASQLYADGLAKITKEYGERRINPSRFKTAAKLFDRELITEAGDLRAPATKALMKDLNERLFMMPSISTKTLFDLDKVISSNIDEAMPGNAFASSRAVQQLSELRTRLRGALEKTLEKQPKGLGEAYLELKKNYGKSQGDLLPKLGQNVIRAAKDGDYSRLGNLLIKQTNVNKIEMFMRSIDRAYIDIAKANKGKAAADLIVPGVKTAAQAKALVRQSFIKNMLTKAEDASTDFKTLKGLASGANSPEGVARSKAILGDAYPDFSRLMNAIHDSSVDGKRGLFSLAVRSKEISAGIKIGQAPALLGGGAAGLIGLPMAAAILTVPSVLAKIATNKRAVNRLLALEGTVKRTVDIKPELVVSGLAKVFAELSDEDRAAIQSELKVKF